MERDSDAMRTEKVTGTLPVLGLGLGLGPDGEPLLIPRGDAARAGQDLVRVGVGVGVRVRVRVRDRVRVRVRSRGGPRGRWSAIATP